MVKIGEGMVSEAHLENGRIFLIGKRPDAFKIYTELKRNLDFFQGKIKSLKIPGYPKVLNENKIKLTRLVGAIRFFQHIVRIYTHLLDEFIPVFKGLIKRYEVEQ